MEVSSERESKGAVVEEAGVLVGEVGEMEDDVAAVDGFDASVGGEVAVTGASFQPGVAVDGIEAGGFIFVLTRGVTAVETCACTGSVVVDSEVRLSTLSVVVCVCFKSAGDEVKKQTNTNTLSVTHYVTCMVQEE